MTAARDKILGDVRAQIARCPQTPLATHEPQADTLSTDALIGADLSSAFEARLQSVGGHVHRVPDTTAAAQLIERLADERGARQMGLSDSPLLEEVRRSTGRELVDPTADRDALLACDIGVTSAQAGIAETGSLVLVSNNEQGRLLSLLPPVHIALLPMDRMVATLGDGLALARGQAEQPPAAITLITGPSRTADIELTLVVGVHGPRELHVVLLTDR